MPAVFVSGFISFVGVVPATGREPGCRHDAPSVLRSPSRFVSRVLGRLRFDAICFALTPARKFHRSMTFEAHRLTSPTATPPTSPA